MDPSRLNDAVAARVVAWHNRNPLARRIGAAQVHSVGHVLLPFAVPVPAAQGAAADAAGGGTSSLRERALARARQGESAALPPAPPRAAAAAGVPGGAEPNFDENFIAPLSPRSVARWARRHGQPLAADRPGNAPLREVIALPLPAGMQPLPVLVLTAAIEIGKSRRRVLLGTGDASGGAVLGRRIPSLGRGGLFGLLLAAAVALPLLPREAAMDLLAAHSTAPAAGVASALAPAASAASAPALDVPQIAPVVEPAAWLPQADAPLLAVPAAAAASSTPVVMAAAEQATAASAFASAASAAGVADVEPRLGRIDLPSLGLPRDKGSKSTARDAWRGERGLPPTPADGAASAAGVLQPVAAGPAAAVPAGRSTAVSATATETATASATASPAAAPARAARPAMEFAGPATFAVSSRLLRTRAEAEQVRDAMQGLLGIDGNGGKGTRPESNGPGAAAAGQSAALVVEVLPQGEDFRVVGWPFGQRALAEKARSVLVSRGMRVEVVAF